MWRADSLEKTLILRKMEGRRPCSLERWRAGGEGDNRGWDGWMASPTQWTWVWASSGRWWRTGRPGALRSMGLQRVRHDWATEHHHQKVEQGIPRPSEGPGDVAQASLVAQRVRRLPVTWETWVRSLGWEDPLEKEMAPHSVLLPGESHGWRSLVGCSPQGRGEADVTE